VRRFYTYEPRVVERIVDLSQGRPLTIQALCWQLIERVLAAKRRRVTEADLNAVQEQVLGDVRRILESGSSQAGLPTSLPEALQRIAELERELTSRRSRMDSLAAHDASPAPPAASRGEGTE
jgi:hypothetical protein